MEQFITYDVINFIVCIDVIDLLHNMITTITTIMFKSFVSFGIVLKYNIFYNIFL